MFELDDSDVVAIAGGMNKACYIKGRQIYESKMVRNCLAIETSSNVLKVFANVISTTTPRGNGFDVEIKLDRSAGEKQILASCSCQSGMSECCKHVMSTLIKICTEKQIKRGSCTEIPRQWGNFESSLDLACIKISNFCVTEKRSYNKPLVEQYKLSEVERAANVRRLIGGELNNFFY